MIKLPIINRIFPSYKSKIIAVIVTGVIVGGGVLFMYMLRAHTYLGDDPAACVNCHIMSPYYATWFHSSHARDATCNDCHVPHENAVKKWTFKGIDGKIDYMLSQVGEGKACWDCHRDVPHGGKNSLSTAPGAIVPLPESPVPEWLQKMIDNKE